MHQKESLEIVDSLLTEPKIELQTDPLSEPEDLPPPNNNPWQKWLIWLVVLGLLGGGCYYAYTQYFVSQKTNTAQKRKSRLVSVKRTTLPILITANGTIQPELSINVSPKTAGRLKSLQVKEGNIVKKGQVLARMDDSNLQGQLIQLQGQVSAAQSIAQVTMSGNRPQEISQAKANLENAIAATKQTEIIFRQNEKLYQQGAISGRDYETSRTSLQANQARVRQLQQALSLQLSGSRPEEVARTKADVVAAQGSLLTVKTLIEDTIIRAPFDGTVSKKFADPGAYVTPQTSGSSVSSATASSILALTSNNQVNAFVAETDIAKIQVGQKMTFTADAYPDQKFRGQVVSITPQATVTQNVTSFEVRANIQEEDKKLMRTGMNVSVLFNVGTLSDVLVVPTVAIVRQKGMSGVYVKGEQGEEPEFVAIETGISAKNQEGRDVTEVKSGLKGDEEIYISFPDGKRPRSRAPGFPGITPSGRGGRG